MTLILNSSAIRVRCHLTGSLAKLITQKCSFASLKKNKPSTKPDDHQQGDRFNWVKLSNLLRGLNTFLHTQEDPIITGEYIHGRLSRLLPKTNRPQEVYQEVISLLVKRQRTRDAIDVYRRMLKDTIIPTPRTQAEMTAVTLASEPDADLQPVLDAIAADPSFTEDHLLHLLWIASQLGAPFERLLQFAGVFIESRGEDYTPNTSVLDKLLEVQTRAGQLDEALETALMYDGEDGKSKATPYGTIISNLRHTNITDTDAFNKVLLEMKSHNISPHIDIFNHLISRELRLNSISGAFAFYHLILKMSKSSSTTPNAGTFGPLFKFLANAFTYDPRGPGIRVFKHPNDILPPRQLFRDMLFFYDRKSYPVDTTFLNLVLRAFIQSGDYVGALVTLNTFRIFHLSPSVKTYFVVMRYIVRRARADLRLGLEWGQRFMGADNVSSKKRHQINEVFAQRVVTSACYPTFHLTGDLFAYLAEQNLKPKYKAPTVAMIEGEEKVPKTTFDLVPLQRILRRAVLADLDVRGNDDQNVPPSIRVSRAIIEAKAAMVPGQEHRSQFYNAK